MTTAATTPTLARPAVLSRRSAGLLAFLGVFLLVYVRAAGEWAMMSEFGSDPQMPIWIMLMWLRLAFWLIVGSLAAALVVVSWQRRWTFRAALVLLLGWAFAIAWSSWEFQSARQALADAHDPSTSSARLQQLTEFTGIQAGYELDNRIAANPNTSPETLRKLYSRRQMGTLMVLARRPDVPEDVLQAMVDHDLGNEWIRRSLKGNPSLTEKMRQKLDAYEQPAAH